MRCCQSVWGHSTVEGLQGQARVEMSPMELSFPISNTGTIRVTMTCPCPRQ